MSAVTEFTSLAKLTRENLRLRGDLLTVATRVSHDLRTPLGNITTSCDLFREMIHAGHPAGTPPLAPVFDSAEEISRLLERVSFLLRASLNPPPQGPIGMEQPVSAALQRLESRILATSAEVAQPPEWPTVEGITSWLECVWWNLIVNALQHGGEPLHIRLGWFAARGESHFWVEDDGRGVPVEARSRLFRPFHTLHEPDSAAGLGLSIVQRLIDLQGGSCGYESVSGTGSRFSFTLPVDRNSTEQRPKSPEFQDRKPLGQESLNAVGSISR